MVPIPVPNPRFAPARLLSDDMVVTLDPGKPKHLSTLNAAAVETGFPVRALNGLGDPSLIELLGEGAFHLKINRERVLEVIEDAGVPGLDVPESIDGATMAVHISKVLHLTYGDCHVAPATCVNFIQSPGPVVSVPPGLDLSQIAQTALQLTGMPAADASAFAKRIDWSSTLVIPIPLNHGTVQPLQIDGVEGSVVQDRTGFAVVWARGGMLYGLQGQGDYVRAVSALDGAN
jgi:hypothetical protein